MDKESGKMNKKPVLVIMAAGMGSRYGGLKQLDPVGNHDQVILDYSIYDARRAGFETVVFVIKPEIEADFKERVGRRLEKCMNVQYVYQLRDDLPEGYTAPADRTKPWGTAQAALAARSVVGGPFALINADDKSGRFMVQNTKARVLTYSLRTDADFRGRIVETRLDGTLLQLNGKDVEVLFTGRFNAYNLTAVFGASVLLGWDMETVLVNMSRLVPVAGRFQTFHSHGNKVTAIVDYAHTPDAVVNVISSIREVVGTKGKIITVVGAGGNRDKGKRPIMAQEAARLSDRVILTSDNPRFEEPADILHDMEAGIADNAEARRKTISIVDRREAIRAAIAMAGEGDVVLVAGKGHEDYQEIQGVKHHFDDREVVREILTDVSL